MQYGAILVNFASWNSFIALLFLLDDITTTGIELGVLWAVSGLAPLLFGVLMGVFVDRFNFKKGIIVIDLIRAILTLGFIVVPLLNGWVAWGLFFMLRFFIGLGDSYSFAARQAAIPQMMNDADLNMNFTMMSVVRLSGLTIGGALVSFIGLNDFLCKV